MVADGQRDQSQHRVAWLVSAAGYAPLLLLVVSLALVRHDNPLHGTLADGLRISSAIVLSFLGGVRWGIAYSAGSGAGHDLVFAALPAVIAVVALYLPPAPSIAVLLLAFSALGAWDSLALFWRPELSGFARLRVFMTLATAVALFAALFLV